MGHVLLTPCIAVLDLWYKSRSLPHPAKPRDRGAMTWMRRVVKRYFVGLAKRTSGNAVAMLRSCERSVALTKLSCSNADGNNCRLYC
jgi:hypothetical protein